MGLGMDILTVCLHNLTVQMNDTEHFSQYLPVEEDALRWGLYVVNAGFAEILPDSPYPPGRHPEEYHFSGGGWRKLDEYQLVYIARGRGFFETTETGRVRIQAGQVFLLFPGVPHRYRPVKKQGWDESWIGFNGEVAVRLMNEFFTPEKAVIRVGYDQELRDLIHSITDLMQETPAGYQQLMAARTMETLALTRSRAMSYHAADREVMQRVQQARNFLLRHSEEDVDMEKLATQLGLSYSRFRAMFKEHTGTPPHQYQLDIRINKARELLRHSSLSISEIAERLGFSSVYYFSRLFKKREGGSPSEYRKRLGTRP
jgi:AraC-like DNA-binding protein